jgi:hypothetical protein
MKPNEQQMRCNQIAMNYIRAGFQPVDRLAVLLVNKNAGSVVQRLASVQVIATREFQEWLRDHNTDGFDVYLSANALKPDATGRTKSDVGTIRHIYLDFDENGTAAVQQLFKRRDLPVPSLVVNTSPDKWQVLWHVEDFAKHEAESLQRMLARQTGADRAATDCARVLRFPGFYIHKYGEPYLVRLEPPAAITGMVYHPEQFPKISAEDRVVSDAGKAGDSTAHTNTRPLSQSERDWAYAKRALARGDPREVVIAAIVAYRRFEKHNPYYYAELTVKKAAEQLAAEMTRDGGPER